MIAETPLQHDLASLKHQNWDVLIVGAGPAGSTAAAHLALLGHRVLLLERHRFPRDKACGDILIADALRALERLGLLDRVRSMGRLLDFASIFSPSRVEVGIPGRYVTLRRIFLDALIASRAVEAGVVLCQATAEKLFMDGNLIHCVCGGTVLRARVGLIATGANINWYSGTSPPNAEESSALAVRQYVRSSYPLDRLVFSYDRSTVPGYAWISPLSGEQFNIGCGVSHPNGAHGHINLRMMLDRFVSDFPLARKLMAEAEILTPLRGARLRCGLDAASSIGNNQILAIGETIGTTYPFTGEGIGKAMETAELAAQIVHDALTSGDVHRLNGFSHCLERVLGDRYAGYRAAERWLSHPWLNDFVMRRVRKSKYLQEAFAGIVDETVNPHRIFSLGGLFQSLWH